MKKFFSPSAVAAFFIGVTMGGIAMFHEPLSRLLCALAFNVSLIAYVHATIRWYLFGDESDADPETFD